MTEYISRDRLAPKWLRDMLRLLPIRSQFVFSGNTSDYFLLPKPGESGSATVYDIQEFHQCAWKTLSGVGYELIVRYNPVDGVSLYPGDKADLANQLGIVPSTSSATDLGALLAVIQKSVHDKSNRLAVLIERAPRILHSAQNLSASEHRFFTACEKLASDAQRQKGLFNPVIWLVNRPEDLPSWFGRNNSRIHFQEIGKPDQDQRLHAAPRFLEQLGKNSDSQGAKNFESYARLFADMTDGFTLGDMEGVARLARVQGLKLDDVDDAVRSYKTGDPTLDNPWSSKKLKERIKEAETAIPKQVRGQPAAVQQALDILKRSSLGLTGAQAPSTHGRPRGVLFLAGPTGVGKTELAKALTKSIFGDMQAYIRFDMSEFSAEHSDARLLGAPPGYVGYEGGGELTNAIRQRPFSLILFDEIEKANQRILDKFLQILEDGRITDGRGETVFFSECVIVFTSNLGIIERDDRGNPIGQLVKPGDDYEKVVTTVRKGIEEYFKYKLGRPEILNRLGDNIVVFNFIQPEIALEIFDSMIGNIEKRLCDEHRSTLKLADSPKEQLLEICTADLSNGGRGIGSNLETALVNPLARALFDAGAPSGKVIEVTAVVREAHNYSLKLNIT